MPRPVDASETRQGCQLGAESLAHSHPCPFFNAAGRELLDVDVLTLPLDEQMRLLHDDVLIVIAHMERLSCLLALDSNLFRFETGVLRSVADVAAERENLRIEDVRFRLSTANGLTRVVFEPVDKVIAGGSERIEGIGCVLLVKDRVEPEPGLPSGRS